MRSKLLLALSLVFVSGPALSMTLNVRDFGAKADGVTDDTPAFQKALDESGKLPGSKVVADAGRYLIAGTIYVRPNSTLQGQYVGPGRQRGTILLSTFGKGKDTGVGCVRLEAGSAIKGFAFEYPEQSADSETPVKYPYTISSGGDGRIEEIFLYNSYQGIDLDSAHANLVRNVWGEPLAVGINSDHTYDISRIENVHFWPYFSNGKPIRKWIQANGIAFQFGRSDWQYVFNTFSFGYHIGYRFYTSKAVPEKNFPSGQTNGNFVGIGADCVGIGIDVEDAFVIGVSIINGEFAPFGGSGTRGVRLQKTNTGNLSLVNCTFWAVTNMIAEVNAGSLTMSSCNFHEWSSVNKNVPAFHVTGGRLNVTGCTFNKGGYMAILEGDASRVSFTNNMGVDDALQVVNRIGKRAVFSANNPEIKQIKEPPID